MDSIIDGHVIRTSGTHNPVTIRTGTEELGDIYAAIGCPHFDVVSLPGDIDVFVDDEGAINGSMFNLPLTIVIHRLGGSTPIFGNGLFLGINANTGSSISLTVEQKALINAAINAPMDAKTVDAVAATLGPIAALGGLV